MPLSPPGSGSRCTVRAYSRGSRRPLLEGQLEQFKAHQRRLDPYVSTLSFAAANDVLGSLERVVCRSRVTRGGLWERHAKRRFA